MRKAYRTFCCVLTVAAMCSGCKKEEPQETVTKVEETTQQEIVADELTEEMKKFTDEEYLTEHYNEFKIGDTTYELPMKVSVLEDAGYTLETSGDDISSLGCSLHKGDTDLKLILNVERIDETDSDLSNCFVSGITITHETDPSVVLYGDISSNTPESYVKAIVPEAYGDYAYTVPDGNFTIYFYNGEIGGGVSAGYSTIYALKNEAKLEKDKSVIKQEPALSIVENVPEELVEYLDKDYYTENANKFYIGDVELTLPIKFTDFLALGYTLEDITVFTGFSHEIKKSIVDIDGTSLYLRFNTGEFEGEDYITSLYLTSETDPRVHVYGNMNSQVTMEYVSSFISKAADGNSYVLPIKYGVGDTDVKITFQSEDTIHGISIAYDGPIKKMEE